MAPSVVVYFIPYIGGQTWYGSSSSTECVLSRDLLLPFLATPRPTAAFWVRAVATSLLWHDCCEDAQ